MSGTVAVRQTGVLVSAFVLAITATAITVRLLNADAWARDQLQFGFAGVPDKASEAAAIWTHNALIVALCAAAALIVQSARWALEHDGAVNALRIGCDLALLVQAANNLITVGVAVGAYGNRMVTAMLPHGPVELAAFGLAATLYIRARRTPITWRTGTELVLTALALLAAAAVLETYLEV